MKKLLLGLVAAGALVTATAVPALAQVDVYVGPGGFSIGTPGYYPGYYYGSPYYRPGYYAYAPGYRYHPGWRRDYYRHHWDDED